MKKSLFGVLLLFLIASVNGQDPFSSTSGNFVTDSKPPEVTVISPNGGETFNYLQPFTITWTATDNSFEPTPISIGISTEQGGSYIIVATNLPNNGSAEVDPPGIITEYAKVWVIAEDIYGNVQEDGSDEYFTFDENIAGISGLFITDSKPPIITVLLPNVGETYYFGDPLLVKWDATDDNFGSTPVTITVSVNEINTTVSGLPNNDSAFVAVPQVITDSALVKVIVQDEFGLSAFDESDAFFSLQGIFIDLKAFLQGPFAGNEMLAHLNSNGYIPLAQPYNGAPWNYTGAENVIEIPNISVVDWVLIEIRDAADASLATSATMDAQQAGFILTDGSITQMDGISALEFGIQVDQNLFAVVWQRNHLGIMSAYPLNREGNMYSYDFTDAADKVYGGEPGHKELEPGIWGMIGGDGDASGHINDLDRLDVWEPQAGHAGYLAGDYDMNGNVANPDKLDIWLPNGDIGNQVPDATRNSLNPMDTSYRCLVPE